MMLPLSGAGVRHGRLRPAGIHAVRLLRLLGAEVSDATAFDGIGLRLRNGAEALVTGPQGAQDAASDWAESGAMMLTGRRDGPPLVAPGSPASAARGAAVALELLTSAAARGEETTPVQVDGARLLGERAAIAGSTRNGAVSCGGSCRLVRAADGHLAVNLARAEDAASVAAWLEVPPSGADPWDVVAAEVPQRSGAILAERAALLGMPVALVAEEPEEDAGPWRLSRLGHRDSTGRPGRVVDLSSMWAGPLCANLLGLAGFEVVKVESTTRPDGARGGPPEFYDLMHGGHRSVALDFREPAGIAALSRLLDTADIVIESSRPRALEQLGLGPDAILPDSPSKIWISITGYGRTGSGRNRVAFGDDAAAAAGLVARCDDGAPLFCGDAIADPLTGVHAAAVALAMWVGGCGGLADVAMRDVAASTLDGSAAPGVAARAADRHDGEWHLETAGGVVAVAEPAARPAVQRAAPSGSDSLDRL